MFGPRKAGNYPDRDIDCEEAITEGLSNLVERATTSGASEVDATAALADGGALGIRDVIDDAVAAGWSAEEATRAVTESVRLMYLGATGTDPNE